MQNVWKYPTAFANRICQPCVTISEFKVVICAILILFITFRPRSLFQNNVSISSEISLTFPNDRVSKSCSWKHVYWRSFINASLLKFLYSRYCIIFTLCLLQKTFKSVKVILWKSDDPVSITVKLWKYSDLFVMISSIVDPFPHCRSIYTS